MIVELEAVDLAEIARFVDPQDRRFHEVVEPTHHLRRRYLVKIPWSDGALDWLQQCILADAFLSAQYQRVINF